MKKELKELIQKLVSFKTIAENVKEKQAAIEFVKEWMEKRGVEVKVFPHEKSPALMGTVKGEKEGNFLMMGHVDVVPAPGKMFEMKEENGVILGRGVADDKGPVAVCMLVLEEVMKRKTEMPTVKLLVTSDEETGGFEGAGKLMEEGKIGEVDAALVPDGGDENEVVCKEKGVIHVDFEMEGKMAHGARPWMGENAIEKAWEVISEVKRIFEKEQVNEEHWHSTVNVGKISGGKATNQVPDKAEASLDVRFTEVWELADLAKKIEEVISKRGGKVMKMTTGEMMHCESEHELVQGFLTEMGEEMGGEMKVIAEHGSSDARWLAKLGVPVWIHRPKSGEVHGDQEWMDLESGVKMVKGVVRWLSKWGK